ncbi:MAG TPA: FAD-binding oxidoreductase, partial [Candidatus Binatia bacterium]|nr:FAD-binding oxidoreductase [Candidatus Binatia bacterium]
AAIGDDALAIAPEALAARRIDGKQPAVVCRPPSAEQIATALKICSEARAAVAPWGGGTAMAIGNPPRQIDVVLETTRLDRVIDHDHANLTVTAQSGVTLRSLQARLALKNQFAPVDPPFPDRATLGGIVAANLNGARRSSYGSVRDLVIGMKIALIDGTQIKTGGKVVKNVAGYDMSKLFAGSLGTLGVITELTLRLAPLAESAATLLASGTLEQCHRLNTALFRSTLLPASVFLSNDGEADRWRLAVWCEGFPETTARHLRDLKDLAATVGADAEIWEGESHEAFWRERGDFPLQANRLVFRVSVPRATIFQVVPLIHAWGGAAISCDATAGTLWIACDAKKSLASRFAELTALAQAQGGHTVIFAAPAELKRGLEVWGPTPAAFVLMREIKHRFDPDGLLNPGRFVGGL